MPGDTPLIFALTLEITSLILLRAALQKRIWSHLGALFVMFAVAYHGLGEIAAHLYPTGPERAGINASSFDTWQLTVGPAILVFTCVYLLALGRSRRTTPEQSPDAALRVGQFFNWRYMLILIAPMYLLTLRGKVFVTAVEARTSSSFSSGLVAQFMFIAIILACYSYLVEKGTRRLLPILIGVSLATILIGQRGALTVVIIPLLWVLARAGIKPSRKQIAAVGGLVLIAALVISGSRATVGRAGFGENKGASSRFTTTIAGARAVLQGKTSGTFIADYFNRIDGNDFAAGTDMGVRRGIPRPHFQTLSDDFFLAVPSIINHHKLQADILKRNEEQAIEARYDLGPINRLPTALGTLNVYYGPRWLMVFAALLAALFAVADRWLKKATPGRLMVGVGLMLCVASYEGSLSVYPVILRGALVLGLVVKAIELLSPFLPGTQRLRYRPAGVDPGAARTVVLSARQPGG